MSRLPSGNIVGYLPKSDRKKWRRKLRRAYQNPTYEEAKAALKGLHKELQQMNRSAARSLEEGLEQTLTLHRLGVFEEVGRSLKTTNAIENLNSLFEDYIGKVKRWHHSKQRARWFALGLLEHVPTTVGGRAANESDCRPRGPSEAQRRPPTRTRH
jgi:hypothetical protein